jgi:hypothetical protein
MNLYLLILLQYFSNPYLVNLDYPYHIPKENMERNHLRK